MDPHSGKGVWWFPDGAEKNTRLGFRAGLESSRRGRGGEGMEKGEGEGRGMGNGNRYAGAEGGMGKKGYPVVDSTGAGFVHANFFLLLGRNRNGGRGGISGPGRVMKIFFFFLRPLLLFSFFALKCVAKSIDHPTHLFLFRATGGEKKAPNPPFPILRIPTPKRHARLTLDLSPTVSKVLESSVLA